MANLIPTPTIIMAAGNKYKEIAEYVGRLNSATESLSIAHMKSPEGWSEPGQIPDFDEYTVVLRGSLCAETRAGTIDVKAGQAILARRGEWGAIAPRSPMAPSMWRFACRPFLRNSCDATNDGSRASQQIAPDAGIIETLATIVRARESDAEIGIEFHSAVW